MGHSKPDSAGPQAAAAPLAVVAPDPVSTAGGTITAPQLSDGERLLLLADTFAQGLEPGTATIERINGLLAAAAPAWACRFETAEQFHCALQLALAEGRLAHVTTRAGLLPPCLERVKLALLAYLDFTQRHRAVAHLCLKARNEFPKLAELVQQRNAGVALLISVELSSIQWRRPQECARLLQAVLTDVAVAETLEGGTNAKLRAGLAACAQALAEGFAPPRNPGAPKRADA